MQLVIQANNSKDVDMSPKDKPERLIRSAHALLISLSEVLMHFCRQMDFLFPQLGELRGDPDCSKDLYDTHVSRVNQLEERSSHDLGILPWIVVSVPFSSVSAWEAADC